jgi:hypothetical protein
MDYLSTGDCASLIRFEGDRSPHPPSQMSTTRRNPVVAPYIFPSTSLRDTLSEVRHETRGMPNGAFDAQGLVHTEINLERRVGHVDSET